MKEKNALDGDLEDLLADELEEEDGEEEDEEAVKDTAEWDNTFMALLPKIAKKDPEIYQPKEFFVEGIVIVVLLDL